MAYISIQTPTSQPYLLSKPQPLTTKEKHCDQTLMTSPLINGLNKRGACQNHGQRETGSWEKKGNVPLQRELNKHGEKRESSECV